MRIILNPEEYAKVCKCSLELATKRCSHYENLYKIHREAVCPTCNAESRNLYFDDDNVPNEITIVNIRCRNCKDTFSTSDARLRDWEAGAGLFDQVLDVIDYGKGSVMGFAYDDLSKEEWIQFVQESTNKLYNDDL
ncbi:hypothetical protein [Bacillus massiliigorillae]|uniref:hypothetical protein n=1 Tax=Bacillus massiliigorillae TaxID=1243664 RepID=UPI0003A8D69A|nr:hypothetical protein [Bacillus massiliigorillae]